MPDQYALLDKTRPPLAPGQSQTWGRLIGASVALAAAEYARHSAAPLLALAEDARHADQLEAEIRYFAGDDCEVLHFVEWETLPWDSFSPHQDIISRRLSVLAELPRLERGVVIASAQELLQRLPPTHYVRARSMSLTAGQRLDRDAFVDSLVSSGYYRVPQVAEHGEFAVRGSLLDVFPMGADEPVRIDLLDDDIETLRRFAPDTQLSGDAVDAISLLPAREVPLDADGTRVGQMAIHNKKEPWRVSV